MDTRIVHGPKRPQSGRKESSHGSFSDITGGTTSSLSKESASLISSHAMRLGIYSINLGTKIGQKLHTAHMLILPLIPIIIIVGQCASDLGTYTSSSSNINTVLTQVQ